MEPIKRRQSIHQVSEEKEDEEMVYQCKGCSIIFKINNDTETKLTDEELEKWKNLKKENADNFQTVFCKKCDKSLLLQTKETSNNYFLPAICVVLALTIMIGLMISNEYFTSREEKPFDVNVEELTSEEIEFEEGIDNLRTSYSEQEDKVWYTLAAGIKSVVKVNQPSVFLMLYENEAAGKTARCLANDASIPATRFMMNRSQKPHIISGAELIDHTLLEDPGLLLVRLNNTVRNKGVLIVTELQDVPPKVATQFHYFCDRYSPLVDKAVYFFTLKVDQSSYKLQQKAENKLKELWSASLPDNLLNPLITRMTPYALQISSDSTKC